MLCALKWECVYLQYEFDVYFQKIFFSVKFLFKLFNIILNMHI